MFWIFPLFSILMSALIFRYFRYFWLCWFCCSNRLNFFMLRIPMNLFYFHELYWFSGFSWYSGFAAFLKYSVLSYFFVFFLCFLFSVSFILHTDYFTWRMLFFTVLTIGASCPGSVCYYITFFNNSPPRRDLQDPSISSG